MILGSAIMQLKCCMGDPFRCEEGASYGSVDGREVRRRLVRNIVQGACIGVLDGGISEGDGRSTL